MVSTRAEVESTLARLEALLDEERAAIRAIDTGRVLALAEEKGTLVESLHVSAFEGDVSLRLRFQAIVARLRENGVLLVHARNASRDLVSALTPGGAGTYDATGTSSSSVTQRRRLSLDV